VSEPPIRRPEEDYGRLASPDPIVPRGTEGDELIRWWRPGWGELVRHVGYRWVFLVPAVVLLVLGLASLFFTPVAGSLALLGVKMIGIGVAVAVSLAAYVIRVAVQARTEPFCIFCGYDLTGLPDHYRCPECGRQYTWELIAEYRRDPQSFIHRWKALRKLPESYPPFAAGAVPRRHRAKDGTE